MGCLCGCFFAAQGLASERAALHAALHEAETTCETLRSAVRPRPPSILWLLTIGRPWPRARRRSRRSPSSSTAPSSPTKISRPILKPRTSTTRVSFIFLLRPIIFPFAPPSFVRLPHSSIYPPGPCGHTPAELLHFASWDCLLAISLWLLRTCSPFPFQLPSPFAQHHRVGCTDSSSYAASGECSGAGAALADELSRSQEAIRQFQDNQQQFGLRMDRIGAKFPRVQDCGELSGCDVALRSPSPRAGRLSWYFRSLCHVCPSRPRLCQPLSARRTP